MFNGVPWDNVRGAWYRVPIKGEWKRLLAKGVTNHLIAAASHSNKLATKDQIIERAREVVAECARRVNIRKLDDLVNDGDTKKRTEQEPWNTIIARTGEGILCPACVNATPNIFTLC